MFKRCGRLWCYTPFMGLFHWLFSGSLFGLRKEARGYVSTGQTAERTRLQDAATNQDVMLIVNSTPLWYTDTCRMRILVWKKMVENGHLWTWRLCQAVSLLCTDFYMKWKSVLNGSMLCADSHKNTTTSHEEDLYKRTLTYFIQSVTSVWNKKLS